MSKQDKRKMIIMKIANSLFKIKKEGLALDKEKLIAALGVEHGLARRTAMEYICCGEFRAEQMIKEEASAEKEASTILDENTIPEGSRQGTQNNEEIKA